MRRLLSALLLTSSLAACDGGGSSDDGSANDSAAEAARVGPGSDTAMPASPEGSNGVTGGDATSHSTDVSSARLAIEGEGLRVFAVPSGSATPLPFGTAKEATIGVLTRVLGSAPVETGVNDCGLAFATWPRALAVTFDGDRFAGWSVGEGSTITTAAGAGIGSTRAEVEAAHVVAMQPSTLGAEFTIGDIAGLLESDAPDARVLNLWAGNNCIAR